MESTPYWLDVPYTSRQSLKEDVSTEVVIIGGGITGISTAYHSAKEGLKTILIEQEALASGSAGKNAGMVVDGLHIDFSTAVQKYGMEPAKEIWGRTVEGRKLVGQLIQDHEINCDFEQSGSLYISSNKQETEALLREHKARETAGFVSEIISAETQFPGSPFHKALLNRGDCILHPVKFLRNLAHRAEENGVRIFENTKAESWDAHSVTTTSGVIQADNVVLAVESLNPH